MSKEEISDELWLLIQPLLPPQRKRWSRRHNNRKLLNAILWVLYEGGSWRLLPKKYGKWNSAYRRYQRWRTDGIWKKIEGVLADFPEYRTPLPPHKYSGVEAKRRKALNIARRAKRKTRYGKKCRT